MSSRLAWIADFTLAVRLATSSLYFASSLSSSVTLAFTMAMLSFIRGTWSFMSRIFCCRMISGSSAAEMKKPMKDRITLDNRCHIDSSCSDRNHSRHLVVHVTNILLQNDLRVFRRRDEETNERPHHPR